MTVKTKARPATAADIRTFFGKDAPRTIRARALDVNGELVGIAGYYVAGGFAIVFSDLREGIPKMTIWREAIALMNSINIPALCVATDTSGPFLERLGWEYAGSSTDGEVYKWQR